MVLLQADALSNGGQNGTAADQVRVEVDPQHPAAKHSPQHTQPVIASHTLSDADEAQLNKKAKCCACTIM